MSLQPRAFVTGIGVLCAGAKNVAELRSLLAEPRRSFAPPTLFPCTGTSAGLPAAEIGALPTDSDVPRTHQLALLAAREAVGSGPAPDAIIVGTTTGGILRTEAALKAGSTSPEDYCFHGLDTVALSLAQAFGVHGPVMTISTACSSAAVALAVGHALLRSGLARRVLVGGADSLCRLTFHGFRSLQLLAPDGCAPLDANRAGMTVAEGAGFLLLESAPSRPILAVLAGTGLSCDAYHASSPHPEGAGAALAIGRALDDAGISPSDVDYINLHGTGTTDNDAAEAKAVRQIFGKPLPPLSSTKGLTGHPLAAAGGIEAVIATIAIGEGLLPANTGLLALDPALQVVPVAGPTRAPVKTVLSNSFGFGGNNACVVLQAPTARAVATFDGSTRGLPALRVASAACFTAVGDLPQTWDALMRGASTVGFVPDAAFVTAVAATFARRLKRLPRLMLALAQTAHQASGATLPPGLIAVGTAWGALAETHDFLRKLFESNEQFSSPTDFIGSVHNAPAGQIALLLGAAGPNLTCAAGDRSFAQALLCASLGLAAGSSSALVIAAEAYESHFSPLFEPASQGGQASDGGAALVVLPDDGAPGPRLRWLGESAAPGPEFVDELELGSLRDRYDAILVSRPAGFASATDDTIARIAQRGCPLVTVRDRLGQHASLSATVVAILARAVTEGTLPLGESPLPLVRKRLLFLDLGARSTAVEVFA
jgi:3-oxoacyl-(acyl-carrier-protein) synthase